MSDPKFDASTPVWVEIVPTVIEFDVTPGALLAASAPVAVVITMPVAKADPASTVANPALIPCLTRMLSPFIRRASPPGCRSLYLEGFTPIAHPLRADMCFLGRTIVAPTLPLPSAFSVLTQSVVTASASAQEQPPAVEVPERTNFVGPRRREYLHVTGHVWLVAATPRERADAFFDAAVAGGHRGHPQHAVLSPQNAHVGDDARHPLTRRRHVCDQFRQALGSGQRDDHTGRGPAGHVVRAPRTHQEAPA